MKTLHAPEPALSTDSAPPSLLQLQQVTHAYGSTPTLQALGFSLAAGQIGCLLGPSGCGKTTALRCIAGFEAIRGGSIRLHGRTISEAGFSLPAEQRNIGMVFQDYALFPHLTVAANIGFGLHLQSRAQRRQRVAALLETVGLAAQADAYPHDLSGGQQQRVALARALAPQPQLLLLDEPFSNLDGALRERLSLEVRAILRQHNITAILVTHDQQEAFAMADQIGVLHQGRLQQWGSGPQLYQQPANRFVAGFIGESALLPATLAADGQLESELGRLPAPAPTPASGRAGSAAAHWQVLVRPEAVLADAGSRHQATVLDRTFRGAGFLYTLQTAGGTRLLAWMPSQPVYPVGGKIGIRLALPDVVAFAHGLD